MLKSRFHFWDVINKYISANGLLAPIKISIHGAQSTYSENRGEVDEAKNTCAVFRSLTLHLK